MSATIIIPARWDSKRFPGKLLAEYRGKRVIDWTIEAARATGLPCYVAADEKIGEALGYDPEECCSGNYRNGTERVSASLDGGYVPDFIVNVQGDEVDICPMTIQAVLEALRAWPIATAVWDSYYPKGGVRVATVAGQAHWFSRQPISRWRHIGVYGYRREALHDIVRLPPTEDEQREGLEQLRWIGRHPIGVVVGKPSWAINDPADLEGPPVGLLR